MSMDDLQAIQTLKAGDIHGLETLVARYQHKAIRVAFLVTHDQTLAEDVVQESFLRIYRRIKHFDPSRPFEPYLLRSVVNAALNAVKQTGRHVSLEGDIHHVEGLLAQAASVESEVEYIQLKQEIIAALARLEPRQRAAVVQRYYLEMTEKEMAAALHVPAGTVKWLLSTARAEIRALLGWEGSVE
jgi:RNA polymerase sigma-70 factor (ECF subfamily)